LGRAIDATESVKLFVLVRYVQGTFIEATLQRRESLEQFLGRTSDGRVGWIEVRPVPNGFEIWRFDVPDVGSSDLTDLYEFGDDSDAPLNTLREASEALDYAVNQLGANPRRWVNVGMVESEYVDFIAAGRPALWP